MHDGSIEAAVSQFRDRVSAVRRYPARPAETVPLPDELVPAFRNSLAQRGIRELFTHQADAFYSVSGGKNVVVVTPTASGKTLCYNLPVLNTLLSDPGARAIYLFPTKALAEDQLHELQAAVDAAGANIKAFTYDGDTPQDARKAIRERANVVLTNPDMLHSGILPHHTRWAKML
jgi:DEAD/DEAH box helicase domain-containing protein